MKRTSGAGGAAPALARRAQELRLRWTTGALADLESHWQFLAERSVDHADRVEARINDRADALKRFPYLGRLDKRTGTRRSGGAGIRRPLISSAHPE